MRGGCVAATIPAMTTATWITMVGILSFIWGGCFLAVRKAIRSESEKGGD